MWWIPLLKSDVLSVLGHSKFYSHKSGPVQIPKEMVWGALPTTMASHLAQGINSGLFSTVDPLIMHWLKGKIRPGRCTLVQPIENLPIGSATPSI